MEQEYEEDIELPVAVPEKKKRTLTPKQLKNLELMRQKKMAKKKASEMIEESVRNSARDAETKDFSNLKSELSEIKEQLKKKSKLQEIPKKRKKAESESESDEQELGTSYRQSTRTTLSSSDRVAANPYLNQLVRFK